MVDQQLQNDIVVTGMSWTTALGDDLQSVWEKLIQGQTGIKMMPSEYKIRNEMAGALDNNDYRKDSPAKKLQQLTTTTIKKASKDANLGTNEMKRAWLVLGTSFGARLDEEECASETLHQWADKAAAVFNARNRCLSISTACSSGSDSIMVGANLIRSGITDICICGGVDLLTNSKRLAHTALRTMSPTFLHAFDESHDGMLLGEGAAFLVLEKQSSNKKYYAKLLGCGSANDAYGLTAPDPNGTAVHLAIDKSLHDAKISNQSIDVFNAHGSGTTINDEVESKILREKFGNRELTVFATKGAFGHTLGATGAIEAIALILALQNNTIPPIIGLKNPTLTHPFILPKGKALNKQINTGMSLTLGFGGFDTCLIFKAAP